MKTDSPDALPTASPHGWQQTAGRGREERTNGEIICYQSRLTGGHRLCSRDMEESSEVCWCMLEVLPKAYTYLFRLMYFKQQWWLEAKKTEACLPLLPSSAVQAYHMRQCSAHLAGCLLVHQVHLHSGAGCSCPCLPCIHAVFASLPGWLPPRSPNAPPL